MQKTGLQNTIDFFSINGMSRDVIMQEITARVCKICTTKLRSNANYFARKFKTFANKSWSRFNFRWSEEALKRHFRNRLKVDKYPLKRD